MKWLRKFNEELKSDTYKSAANKLKNRHPARANALIKFGDVRKEEEEEVARRIELERQENQNRENYKEWQEDIKRYSPFGLFKFKIKPDNAEATEIVQDFYLKITHWYDEGFGGDPEKNTKFWLHFNISLIPIDEEGYENMAKYEWDYNDGYIFHIWRGYVILELRDYDCIVESFSTDEADNFSGDISIADRVTALRYKRLLTGIFSRKEYPDNVAKWHETKDSLYNYVEETLAQTGISSDFGLQMQDIADKINKTSVNTFYKE